MTRRASSVAVAARADVGAAAVAPPSRRHALREVQYDPRAVVTVPVKRGVVTLIELDPDEAITDVAAGLGSDCSKPEAAWCIAAQAGGRNIFIKPKSAAAAPNNLAVVTDKRTHSFRLVVLADGDGSEPVYRLLVKAPVVARCGGIRPHHRSSAAELPSSPSPPRTTSSPSVSRPRRRSSIRTTRSPKARPPTTSCRRWSSTTAASPTSASRATAKCRPSSMCWATAARRSSTPAWKTTSWWSTASAGS